MTCSDFLVLVRILAAAFWMSFSCLMVFFGRPVGDHCNNPPAGDKGMNTARIALAHQLPRVAGSANCLAEVQPAAWLARVGLHDLIVRFVRGARRLNPPRPPLVPSWDLPIVLAGLQRGPFEPLDSVELKFLSAKTALLTALTSIKRVGDLRIFGERRVACVRAGLLAAAALAMLTGYKLIADSENQNKTSDNKALLLFLLLNAIGDISTIIKTKIMVYKIGFKIENRQQIIDLTELKLKTFVSNKQEISVSPHVTSLRAGCGLIAPFSGRLVPCRYCKL